MEWNITSNSGPTNNQSIKTPDPPKLIDLGGVILSCAVWGLDLLTGIIVFFEVFLIGVASKSKHHTCRYLFLEFEV